MTKAKAINFAKELGIETYNETFVSLCLKGINGHATLVYLDDSSLKLKYAQHLKQMGRDSLKMDLESLLSISKHN